ncbi:hypothetical protein T11_7965 [Trichinella zimbabwensis]|uniref:Uncharacterized protein n=1 Tax=Trichinella zimbabwensis TaxID=268475 RepID=A0A0V1HZ46_9BILA|nr:hypothetical protein T11_7965 [Trichinella zimbabwensis]
MSVVVLQRQLALVVVAKQLPPLGWIACGQAGNRRTTDACSFWSLVHPTDRRPDLHVVKDKHILLATHEKPSNKCSASSTCLGRSVSGLSSSSICVHLTCSLPAPPFSASVPTDRSCELDQQKLTNKINLFRRRIASKSGLGTFVSGRVRRPVGWLVSFATNCLSLAACSWLPKFTTTDEGGGQLINGILLFFLTMSTIQNIDDDDDGRSRRRHSTLQATKMPKNEQ